MSSNNRNGRENLIKAVDKEIENCKKGEKFYDPLRWQIKITKILSAMITAASAIWTGITQDKVAAIITSIAGISTAGIEAMQKEVQANQKRYHYLFFSTSFENLKLDIEQFSESDGADYQQYYEELKSLKKQELEGRKKIEGV